MPLSTRSPDIKTNDLLSPLLILVPSDSLRRRLKILLSQERGLALLNVQVLTFHQLSLRLNAECRGTPPDLHSDLFLEEALRQIIRTGQPGAGALCRHRRSRRRLRRAMADAARFARWSGRPALALAALSEGHFNQRTGERTAQLLVLLQTFQNFCQEQSIEDHADLDRRATEQAPASTFLQQFAEIFYYGFYDLTQIQLDFFLAVARHFPTTLFFPLLSAQPGHDAWGFAERFYERYVQGQTSEVFDSQLASPLPANARLFDEDNGRSYATADENWRCRIVNSFGIHDEVATAAKEILRLVDDGELAFHEIGVVARSLDNYGTVIRNCFSRASHSPCRPPRRTAGAVSFDQSGHPAAQPAGQRFSAQPSHRSTFLALSASCTNSHPSPTDARPDLWDLATRELAICKGIAEWRRLRRFTQRDLVLRQFSDDDEARVIRIAAAQLTSLADLVDTLVADLSNLPGQGTWQDTAPRLESFAEEISRHCRPPTRLGSRKQQRRTTRFSKSWTQLAASTTIEDNVALGDFSHTFAALARTLDG